MRLIRHPCPSELKDRPYSVFSEGLFYLDTELGVQDDIDNGGGTNERIDTKIFTSGGTCKSEGVHSPSLTFPWRVKGRLVTPRLGLRVSVSKETPVH